MAELKKAWGGQFDSNLERLQDWINSGPAGLAGAFASARLANGVPLGSDPETPQWLHTLATQGGRNKPEGANETRIQELEEYMRTQRTKYNRDEKAQRELRDLYARRESRRGRPHG
jgi:hypothetical protein